MLGYFKAVDTENKKIIGFYRYSTVSSKQKKLLFPQQSNGIRFFCCCNGERPLEMKISTDFKLYPAQNNTGILHSPCCPKHIPEAPIPLWQVEKDLTTKLYYHVASPDATAADIAKKINSVTVKRLTYPELRMPDNLADFNKKIYVTQKYIKNYSRCTLYDLSLSNQKMLKDINENVEFFFYGILKSVKTTEFDKKILYIDAQDCLGKKHRFYLDKELFLEQFNNSPNLQWCIAGFVYKKSLRSSILTFSDCYINTIDKIGMFY